LNKEDIHITEIDEYLARRVLEEGGAPFGIAVEKRGQEGFVTITKTTGEGALSDEAVDFELSPSEYLNLDYRDIEDLLASPLITSSALELFDFLLQRFKRFNCLLEFTGNAWKVKITGPV
jgi:hypothetical protein